MEKYAEPYIIPGVKLPLLRVSVKFMCSAGPDEESFLRYVSVDFCKSLPQSCNTNNSCSSCILHQRRLAPSDYENNKDAVAAYLRRMTKEGKIIVVE